MAVHESQAVHLISESPFATVRPDELSAICASSGFQILRNYLAEAACSEYVQIILSIARALVNVGPSFCPDHANINHEAQSAWLLHRDILHAITMPVVQLHNQASALAGAAVCSQLPEELELAFKGEARSAFLWLQCFVGEDEDWCYTRGCPGTHSMCSHHPRLN